MFKPEYPPQGGSLSSSVNELLLFDIAVLVV